MLCYLFGVNFSQLYISEYSLYQEKMIKDKVEKKKNHKSSLDFNLMTLSPIYLDNQKTNSNETQKGKNRKKNGRGDLAVFIKKIKKLMDCVAWKNKCIKFVKKRKPIIVPILNHNLASTLKQLGRVVHVQYQQVLSFQSKSILSSKEIKRNWETPGKYEHKDKSRKETLQNCLEFWVICVLHVEQDPGGGYPFMDKRGRGGGGCSRFSTNDGWDGNGTQKKTPIPT